MFTPECIEQVLAAQHANQAANDAANRDVFVANCNKDWEANAAQYRALKMEVPPNDCAYRGYGQTLPGTSGGYSGYLTGTPAEVIDWRNKNPGGGSSGPLAEPTVPVVAGGGWVQPALPATTGGADPSKFPNPTGGGIFSKLPGGTVSIGGSDVPWVLIGGGLLVAYFVFMRGK